MNVNIFCPSFFCCLEHDNSKSPSDFIVIHGIKVNMTFPGQPRARRRSAQTVRPRPSGCAQPRVVKPTKCPFLRKIAVMVISTLVETGPGWLRVELKCSNSRGMSQTAAAQPQPARHVLLPPPTVFGKLEISDTWPRRTWEYLKFCFSIWSEDFKTVFIINGFITPSAKSVNIISNKNGQTKAWAFRWMKGFSLWSNILLKIATDRALSLFCPVWVVRRILVYFLCTPKLSLGNLTPPHNFNLHSSIPLVISKSSKSSYSPHFIRVYREEDNNKNAHQKNRSQCHDDTQANRLSPILSSSSLFSRNFTDYCSCKLLNLSKEWVWPWIRVGLSQS